MLGRRRTVGDRVNQILNFGEGYRGGDKGKRESGWEGKEEGRKWFALLSERNVKRAKLTISTAGTYAHHDQSWHETVNPWYTLSRQRLP